jgi:hypothetical protein
MEIHQHTLLHRKLEGSNDAPAEAKVLSQIIPREKLTFITRPVLTNLHIPLVNSRSILNALMFEFSNIQAWQKRTRNGLHVAV